MRFFLSVLLLSLPLIPLNAQTASRGGDAENLNSSRTGKTHVVLIGISDYRNLPEDHQLDFADDDAILFGEYLKTWGNLNLKLFLNEKATDDDLIGREIVNTLIKEAVSGDEVIIYFAGHGDVNEDNEGFLLLNGVESTEPYDFNDALQLNKIQAYIQKAAANGVQVTFIADACHSGAVRTGGANRAISEIGNNSVTITSCQFDETSEENIKYGNGHGVFSYYLIQGLMGLADSNNDKKITLIELQTYVQTNVLEQRGDKQTPVFTGKLSKVVATVDDKLLSKAKKEDNLTLALASFGKDKAVTSPIGGISGPCRAMLQLFQEQTIENKFFREELDSLDRLPLSFGTAQSKKMHSKGISAIAVSPDGRYTATASIDGIALTRGKEPQNAEWLKGHISEVKALDFSPNGNLVSGGLDRTVIIWDPVKKSILFTLTKVSSEITVLRFVSETQVLIGTAKGSLILWEPALNISREFKMHKGKINDIEFSNPVVITAGDDGKILTFDLATRKKAISFGEGNEFPVNALKILVGSDQLISAGDDSKISIWNIESRKLVKEYKSESGAIKDIDTDPFEHFCFYAGNKQRKAGVLDLQKEVLLKSKLATIGGSNALVYDPAYHLLKVVEPDGSLTVQEVRIMPEDASATEIHRQLSTCEDLKELQYKLDGTLIIGLNNNVNKVLQPLVNGKPDQPGIEEVRMALRYAEKAYELGKGYEYDADKLEINLLLLQVYEILLSEKKEQYGTALSKLKRISELDPNGAYSYNVSALLYARLNDSKKALEMAAKAEELAPKWAEASLNTGKVMLLTGDNKGAETKFKEAITETPAQSKGYQALGELYLKQGKIKESVVQLEKAKAIDSGNKKINDLYEEASSKLPQNKKSISNISVNDIKTNYWPMIKNHSIYRGYSNELKFNDSIYIHQIEITAEKATISKQGNKWNVIPNTNVSDVNINIFNKETNELIGSHQVFVKSMPKPVFMWGRSKDQGFVDMTAKEFFFGYYNEPDLTNTGIEFLGYEAMFIEELSGGFEEDFNPNATGGAIVFQGESMKIHPGIYQEIILRQNRGEIGKVCVQFAVQYPSGVKEVKSACFNY